MSNDRSIWAFADVRSGRWNKQMIWQGDFRFAWFRLWVKLLWVTAWYCHSSRTIFTTWVCLKVVRAPDFSGEIYVPYMSEYQHTSYRDIQGISMYFSPLGYFLTSKQIPCHNSPHHSFVRCWAHEAHRVFYDRLVTKEDQYLGTSPVWLDDVGCNWKWTRSVAI